MRRARLTWPFFLQNGKRSGPCIYRKGSRIDRAPRTDRARSSAAPQCPSNSLHSPGLSAHRMRALLPRGPALLGRVTGTAPHDGSALPPKSSALPPQKFGTARKKIGTALLDASTALFRASTLRIHDKYHGKLRRIRVSISCTIGYESDWIHASISLIFTRYEHEIFMIFADTLDTICTGKRVDLYRTKQASPGRYGVKRQV